MNCETHPVNLKFERVSGLWIAPLMTPDGTVEVIVDGSDERPNSTHLAALGGFFPCGWDITIQAKKRLRFSFLYKLVRIAPNGQSRIGLQFRNILTGAQPIVFPE